MKVDIAVHGRFHAFELAAGLHRDGRLRTIYTTYPRMIARRFLGSGPDIRSYPLLEVRRRLYDHFSFGPRPDISVAKAFAISIAGRAGMGADILIGWSSALLEAIAPARNSGAAIIVERGSTHIQHQQKILAEAYAELGINFTGAMPEIIDRELAEYEAADGIAVATPAAAETFAERGIPSEKLLINPYGVDLSRFKPGRERSANKRPVILFVGRIGIRKGLPWLLEAFRKRDIGADLKIVGPLDPEGKQLLAGRMPPSTKILGAVPMDRLPEIYASADIYCLPSLEEGGVPMTLLQAMAMELPVVTTPDAAGSVVEDGVTGRLVMPRRSDDLADTLESLAAQPEQRRQMGKAARIAAESGFSWDDYTARAIRNYSRLLVR